MTKSFGHGFDRWVWLQVFLFGTVGLLVASVIKYADNIIKGLATALSMIVSSLLNSLFFGSHVTDQFMAGAVITVTGVYFYSYAPRRYLFTGIWILVAGLVCIPTWSPFNGQGPVLSDTVESVLHPLNTSSIP